MKWNSIDLINNRCLIVFMQVVFARWGFVFLLLNLPQSSTWSPHGRQAAAVVLSVF